jgi:predicted DNA-binding transcriptional regulator AlpA
MPERISTGKAAQICGVSSKTLLKLARDGKVPGAAELEEGRLWRFDEVRLRDWIRRREALCQVERATTSIRGAGPGTPGCRSVGETFDAAYEQLLAQKRQSGSR